MALGEALSEIDRVRVGVGDNERLAEGLPHAEEEAELQRDPEGDADADAVIEAVRHTDALRHVVVLAEGEDETLVDVEVEAAPE